MIPLGMYGAAQPLPPPVFTWTPAHLIVGNSITTDPEWKQSDLWVVGEESGEKYIWQSQSGGLSNTGYAVRWEAYQFDDVEVTLEVGGRPNQSRIGPHLNPYGNAALDGYYAMVVEPNLVLYRQGPGGTGNVRTTLASVPTTLTYTDRAFTKIKKAGSDLSAKAWKIGDPEPGWQVIATDTLYAGGFSPGVYGWGRSTLSRTFWSIQAQGQPVS